MNAPGRQFPAFVSAGEALTDLVIEDQVSQRWIAKSGGAPWNVARAMSALGVPSAFAGAISTDPFGDAVWEASRAADLDLRFTQRVSRSPLLAVVHQTQPPRYFFIGDDSADLYFDPTLLPVGWQHHVRWAHFGGISLARQPLAGRLADLAVTLKRDGVRISYDPNFRDLMDEAYDPMFRRMAELADLVKVSDEDLAGLFRTEHIENALATMRGWNPSASVFLTRGPAGGSLYVGKDQFTAPSPHVVVVDSVGAGDASMAALLYTLMQHADRTPPEHLRFALAGGAAACTTTGASPPDLTSITSLL
ncbi:MAG: carbohydrate kinase [Micropepsaceae bacterium]